MATKLGQITINETTISELDSNPALGSGFLAEIGDQAIDTSTGVLYGKYGTGITDWAPVLATRYESGSTSPSGNKTLTVLSSSLQVLNGTSVGFSITLPDALTMISAQEFRIANQGTESVTIKDNSGTDLFELSATSFGEVILDTKLNSNGTWLFYQTLSGDPTIGNPNFTGSKDGFEDFMFDAYAGNGGNDNQYAFTAVDNSGSSDIDGAVSVVGNNYEGIHILDSLVSATSRPLVHAFNGVNRMKLGANGVAYELRVRIETLSSNLQSFTTRYGLMDIITAGQPTNGVLFSYIPVNQVAQIQTTTPAVLTAGVKTYTQTINGTPYSFISDATPTATEVVTGLKNLINADGPLPVTATGTTTLILTADVAGTAFTSSVTGPNLTTVATTANVPYSGVWRSTVIVASSATTLTTSVPVVANQFYSIKAVINPAGTNCFFYIDQVLVGSLVTAMPTAALRYVFKLEKTVGITSRTTSIDFISWRRTR